MSVRFVGIESESQNTVEVEVPKVITYDHTGFPEMKMDHLLKNTGVYGDNAISLCDSVETANEAIELANILLSYYIGDNENTLKDFPLALYNLYVCIWAAIASTLNETNDISTFKHPRSIPKYVSTSQFTQYIHDRYISLFSISAQYHMFDGGSLKGIDNAIRRSIEVYQKYVANKDDRSNETVYTCLYERKYANNKNINDCVINEFPDMNEYIKFVSSEYDSDMLKLPKKYRSIIFERDETIKRFEDERKNNVAKEESQNDIANDETQNDTIINEVKVDSIINEIINDVVNDAQNDNINGVEVEIVKEDTNENKNEVPNDSEYDEY